MFNLLWNICYCYYIRLFANELGLHSVLGTQSQVRFRRFLGLDHFHSKFQIGCLETTCQNYSLESIDKLLSSQQIHGGVLLN